MANARLDNRELDLIVSAIPAPVLVADYTPIIERFDGMTGDKLRSLLRDDDTLFTETLSLPRSVAASPEWVRLYGSPLTRDLPELGERHFSPATYPELHTTLLEQFTAPFRGITSIVREHAAPTLLEDVIVRSHWSVSMDAAGPRWDQVVIVDIDVTDLRTAQHDLEILLDTKEALVASKDQLIAAVSHEIRTPLSAIVGFAGLLRDSQDLSADERHEMIEHLVQQGADLADIVDDLLISAKANLGQLELAKVTIDLALEAARVVKGMPDTGHTTVSLCSGGARALADPARTRQIIRNLLTNAARYGGPETTLRAAVRDESATLQVRDNGRGVPADNVDKMFEAYQRSDEPSDSVPALGLGLHISRTLARRMGGDLTYRYEDGESVFELVLPRAAASDEMHQSLVRTGSETIALLRASS
jgi:signal transduction histidine kinase